METGTSLSRSSEVGTERHGSRAQNALNKGTEAEDTSLLAPHISAGRPCSAAAEPDGTNGEMQWMARLEGIPEGVRASAVHRRGEYDARRLRSQREIIRDVMLSAADCDTWLTLGELRALTRYGEASISAQLRHLRKLENGGYDVAKRHREEAGKSLSNASRSRIDGRGECVWEYRVARAGGQDVAGNVQG